MKPVLLLQHFMDDGPAYLGRWLSSAGAATDLRCSEAGEPFPHDMAEHGALAVLGGAMSANDNLPALRQAERLIRDAMAQGKPVIGHCLGGQLMARALGAAIGPSARPEVGWHALEWSVEASRWFGPRVVAGAPPPQVFQWHFEAFSLPAGAQWLAGSAACPNQAFSIGPHLAFQFHLELDAVKLAQWTEAPDDDYRRALADFPAMVQSPTVMRHHATELLAAQQTLAASAYRHWLDSAAD